MGEVAKRIDYFESGICSLYYLRTIYSHPSEEKISAQHSQCQFPVEISVTRQKLHIYPGDVDTAESKKK